MSRKDQFVKTRTFNVGGAETHVTEDQADLHIIGSVLKINFVLRDRLGITLKEAPPVEMFLEFIEKLGKFNDKSKS